MRIIVTGCGRSGTQWMANVLATLGLASGHERIYTPELDPYRMKDQNEMENRWRHKDAEASWLAAAWLDTLPSGAYAVLHQVRHPLLVVRCWNSHRILDHEEPAGRFAHAHAPETRDGPTGDRAVQYVLRWNELVERGGLRHTYFRYRAEDVTPDDLHAIVELCGHQVTKKAVKEALGPEGPSRKAGSCRHEDPGLNWEWALRHTGGAELKKLAERYGYT